jgi:alpha-tubulin suppressor-like RCC1 family protein
VTTISARSIGSAAGRRVLAACFAVCLLLIAFSSRAEAAGGTAMGWGYNFSGQVGSGATSEVGPCYCIATPTAVINLAGVVEIAGGYEHGLALLTDGTVKSWGYNSEGQLGVGSTDNRLQSVPVPGLSNVVAVAGGGEHSLALLANGTVMTWGENIYGALGIGSTTGPETCGVSSCSKAPVPVPGISNAIAIGAGYEFSVALLADGTALAWGYDESGALGDGTGVSTGCACVAHPVPVPGVSGGVGLAVGEEMSAVLLADGTMRDWGYNRQSELGAGVESTAGCECLGPVSPLGVAGVKQVAVGGYVGMALLQSGGTQAWGFNEYGAVGNGTFSGTGCKCVPTPVAVGGLAATALDGGANHSVALLADGTGRSWGENRYGQLGIGSTTPQNAPTPILGLNGASEISGTEYSNYAIIGPSQGLSVAMAGAGAGSVGANGVICPPSCGNRYPQGQVEFLRATPAAGTGFAGFSGPCIGTGPCMVRMDSDQTVTATFGAPKGTKIIKAKISSKKSKARFSFSAPGAITGFQCKLIKPKTGGERQGGGAHALAKKGGKARFSKCNKHRTYKHLNPGRYTFKVRARDIIGVDAKPATRTFKIKKVAKHPRR